MILASGARLGPYEILGPLGAGGMGEVYKARDTRLDRTVAIKILSSTTTASPDARQRFEREARIISQLSHPHICALYDVGEMPNPEALTPNPFLVMELLDGETLAERLAKGALPPAQVLRFAIDIADALDKAHRQGIVHRDLKPGNVMVTTSGVKLLDFGLARAAAPLFPAASMSVIDTAAVSPPLTEQGTIAGTLQYMAPEQLEGQPGDARSDIFAFGAVLYEMATGKKAFGGTSRIGLASAILHEMPAPIASTQHASPVALDRLVSVCLAKDPEQRWQNAHDIGLQLASIGESGPPPPLSRDARWRLGWRPWAVAAMAALVAAGALLGRNVSPRAAPVTVRFSLPPPPGARFVTTPERNFLSLSPDGSQVAFLASDAAGSARIWVRSLSAADARPLAGTEGAASLFWSFDSRSIAFTAGDKLSRLDLPAGAAVPLCDVPPTTSLHGTWGSAGQILFASLKDEGIFRVSTSGGTPEVIAKPDRSHGEIRVGFPWFLPDGRRFLYLSTHADRRDWLMLGEAGQPSREILQASSGVQYVDPGYLVFVRDGTLVGQRLDPSSAQLVAAPFSIAGPVRYFLSTSLAAFGTSRSGALVYQSHSDQTRFAWIDRSGSEVGSIATTGESVTVRLSPDGRMVLFDRAQIGTGTYDLWEYDIDRGVETRLTSDRGSEFRGLWLPGGRAVVFSADRGGPPHLFRKDLSTGAEEEFYRVGTLQRAHDVSPDGRSLAFTERSDRNNFGMWTVPLSGARTPLPLLPSTFSEDDVRFSPDGRYIAYASDELGRYEVFVSPVPVTGGKMRVSTGGGALPRWSRDGRELFYLSADLHLVAVPVQTSPALSVGAPQPLFAIKGGTLWSDPKPNAGWPDFDVSLDGRRFLASVPQPANQQPLTVVLNWTNLDR